MALDLDAEALRRIRQAKGMSTDELAMAAQLPVRALVLLERGERRPTIGTLRRVSEALDVEVAELLRCE